MSYELISHTTVSGTTTNYIDVQSIDQTYQDLCFWWAGRANGTTARGSVDFYLRFNNDSTTQYGNVVQYAVGSTRYGNQNDSIQQGQFNGWPGSAANSNNQAASLFGYIPGYTNTTNYQGHHVYMQVGSTAPSAEGSSGSRGGMWLVQWHVEQAINRIEIGFPYETYAPNSTFTLYGVKNS